MSLVVLFRLKGEMAGAKFAHLHMQPSGAGMRSSFRP